MGQYISTLFKTKKSVPAKQSRITRPAPDEIHVWYADLDKQGTSFFNLLSLDERTRAGRFIQETDRTRYVARRGILRKLLGGYLGTAPGSVRFSYNNNDKPALADKREAALLHFNLSHSEEMAVYAFTAGNEIGIDIEKIREIPEMTLIFERFFSPRENEVFNILSDELKKDAFFNCWTRKEAFVKSSGQGLSRPLNGFDVSLVPGEPARLLEINGNPEEVSRWSMRDLKSAPGYAAALAVKGLCGQITSREWPDISCPACA